MQYEKDVGSILKSLNLIFLIVMIYNQTLRGKFENLFKKAMKKSKNHRHKGYNELDEEIEE